MTTLLDLYHYIGADISAAPSGDLQTVTDTLRGQQRVLRRLLTNPGDYIFHTDYGAGLPAYVGRVADVAKITALIRSQINLEASVASSPAPVISVKPIANPDGGGFLVAIQYTDASTGGSATLSFSVEK